MSIIPPAATATVVIISPIPSNFHHLCISESFILAVGSYDMRTSDGFQCNREQLRDTFNQARSEGRRHDAIDIMAPQGTPVLAVTDGTVIKLFKSDMGGITLYELDPSQRYVYYYAHLMSYAEGISEGKPLRRGDVIGYVGDTGNAGAGKYHLHFSISKLRSPHQWSGGD